MWDLSGWIMWNFVMTFASWYLFYKVVTTKPGYLDDSLPTVAKWRGLYEETLESYADENKVKDAEWVSDYVVVVALNLYMEFWKTDIVSFHPTAIVSHMPRGPTPPIQTLQSFPQMRPSV